MKSKKIIMFLLSAGIMFSAYAQSKIQTVSSKPNNASAVNPNVERTRIVNEKIAAEKANKASTVQSHNNNATIHNSRIGQPSKGAMTKNGKPSGQAPVASKVAATHSATAQKASVTAKPATPAVQNAASIHQQQHEQARANSREQKAAYATQHPSAPRNNSKSAFEAKTRVQPKTAPASVK